jgi:hypothetical protein
MTITPTQRHIALIILIVACAVAASWSVDHLEHKYRYRHYITTTPPTTEPVTAATGETGPGAANTGTTGNTGTSSPTITSTTVPIATAPPSTTSSVVKTGTNTSGLAQVETVGALGGDVAGMGGLFLSLKGRRKK